MYKVSADYIFTLTGKPMKEGVLVLDEKGKILEIGKREDHDEQEIDVFHGFIVPGFINTHCHLELSHMKGMLEERTGLIPFIKGVLARREAPMAVIVDAIAAAEKEMIDNGIVAVGDISNTGHTFEQKYKSNLRYYTFVEVFNFGPEIAEETFAAGREIYTQLLKHDQAASIVPHAPYTVSPELFRKTTALAEQNGLVTSIHNQETKAENDFFLKKTGEFNDFYRDWGFDISFFKPTGKNSLASVIEELPKEEHVLLVHNTMSIREDIRLAHEYSKNIYWCFNPNANLYIEDTLPDYRIFMEEGATCTLGTDSLASNWQLSILEEMKVITTHAPYISLEQLLEWGCRNGAQLLKFDDQLGTLEKGKTPGINLLQEVDVENVSLKNNSKVLKLK